MKFLFFIMLSLIVACQEISFLGKAPIETSDSTENCAAHTHLELEPTEEALEYKVIHKLKVNEGCVLPAEGSIET